MNRKDLREKQIGKIFADRLKEMMEINPNLDTQQKLAKASGLSQTAIGRILRGQVSPSLDHVGQIVSAFDSTIGGVIEQPISPYALKYDKERFAKLPEHERMRIESMVAYEILAYEARIAREAGNAETIPPPARNKMHLIRDACNFDGEDRRIEDVPYEGVDRRKAR